MAAKKRKKVRARTTRCGLVESDSIARGWGCCECYKRSGLGTYNGESATACKMCGHKRCRGAMKKPWGPPRNLASVLGVLSELVSHKPPEISPEWKKACSEVTAAFGAAEVHSQVIQGILPDLLSEEIARRIEERLPRAMEIYDRLHPVHTQCTSSARCRHMALIFVAVQDECSAGRESEQLATNQRAVDLMQSGQNVLDWYLSTVS
jgi:hypothetical protein